MTRESARDTDHVRTSRRSFLKKGASLAISLSALAALPVAGCGQQTAAPASPAASSAPSSAPPSASASTAAAPAATSTPDAKAWLAQLYDGAKKEGAVLWYTTHSIPDADALNKDFMERYPGIKSEFWRNTNEAILDKATTEARAGRNAADIMLVSVTGYEEIKAIITPYKPLTYNDFGPDFRDADGYWIGNYLTTGAISYNTNLVKPNEAPKTWEDLLDPKWTGKLCLEAGDSPWLLTMTRFWGRDKALDYMKKLAAQKPQIRTSHITQLDLLAAGEFPIVVVGYNYYVEQLKAKGAPVEWVRLNPVSTQDVSFGLMAKAPHPNAGKLFMEYLSSVEAQQIMAKQGRFPAMFNKVPPNNKALLEVKDFLSLIKPEMYKEQAEADQIFKQLFSPKAS